MYLTQLLSWPSSSSSSLLSNSAGVKHLMASCELLTATSSTRHTASRAGKSWFSCLIALYIWLVVFAIHTSDLVCKILKVVQVPLLTSVYFRFDGTYIKYISQVNIISHYSKKHSELTIGFCYSSIDICASTRVGVSGSEQDWGLIGTDGCGSERENRQENDKHQFFKANLSARVWIIFMKTLE